MKKEEAIEIAKNKAKIEGWNINQDIDAIKLKRRLFYWKDKWKVISAISSSHENGMFIHSIIEISIDDASSKILSSTIRTERFRNNTETIFPALVPVLYPFEKILLLLGICLSTFTYPVVILYYVLKIPICLVKEHLKPKAYCSTCKGELRTLYAKQCRHCFFSWHEFNKQNN